MIYLELIFEYDVRNGLRFTFFHMDTQSLASFIEKNIVFPTEFYLNKIFKNF